MYNLEWCVQLEWRQNTRAWNKPWNCLTKMKLLFTFFSQQLLLLPTIVRSVYMLTFQLIEWIPQLVCVLETTKGEERLNTHKQIKVVGLSINILRLLSHIHRGIHILCNAFSGKPPPCPCQTRHWTFYRTDFHWRGPCKDKRGCTCIALSGINLDFLGKLL